MSGTLFAGKTRIVEVNRIKLEAALGKIILYINNEDKPGLIGDLGQLLADANINIANFHLGRGDSTGEAIALLELDDALTEELLAKVNNLPSVLSARLLLFKDS